MSSSTNILGSNKLVDMIIKKKIGFLGVGQMGGVLLNSFSNLLNTKYSGYYNIDFNDYFYLHDPFPGKKETLRKQGYKNFMEHEAEVFEHSKIILTCVKPDHVCNVLLRSKPKVQKDSLIVSIAAGISIEYLEKLFAENYVLEENGNSHATIGNKHGASSLSNRSTLENKQSEKINKIDFADNDDNSNNKNTTYINNNNNNNNTTSNNIHHTSHANLHSNASSIPNLDLNNLNSHPNYSLTNATEIPKIIRIMSNHLCSIGEAGSVYATNKKCDLEDEELINFLLKNLGLVRKIDEKLMNAFTALTGSGPAFVYHFIESLVDASLKCGVDVQTAREFAAQTVFAAAKYVNNTPDKNPNNVQYIVTTPNGTTIAGLHQLNKHAFKYAVSEAISAASVRGEEIEQSKLAALEKMMKKKKKDD